MTRLTYRRRARRGFSLIELMTVMAVIGLLAALSVPRYRDMKRRAYSANVLSDFNTVRVAAYNYFADNSTYPPDGGMVGGSVGGIVGDLGGLGVFGGFGVLVLVGADVSAGATV